MELQTYGECMMNKGLFLLWDGGDDYSGGGRGGCSGRFVHEFDSGSFSFRWFEGGAHHRLDGPALIGMSGCEWLFMGERVFIDSQDEFEEWLARKL